MLVLLLIGIFSVIRLFPGGFLVNRWTEESTEATRLANQEVDRFSVNAANLMDAVVPVKPVPSAGPLGYSFQVDLNTTPDDLSAGVVNIPGVDPYYYSDANRIRRVIGETVRIPIPSPTTAGQGSLYVLSSGPIYNLPFQQGTQNFSIYVSGAPLARVVVTSLNVQVGTDTNPAQLNDASQYAVDYGDAKVGFYPTTYNRTFLATYSYYDANNLAQTVVDEVINVPASATTPGPAQWFSLTGNGGRPLVPDSDVIGRQFAQKNLTDAWSSDPFEFKVLSPNDGSFANVGVLLFNPLGHDYTEYTANGPVPLTARIDYDVLDWHIIREDRPMPATSPYRMPLALKNIKRSGDPEADQTIYSGIFKDASIPQGQGIDVLIYDLSTGQRVAPANYSVNYHDGIVTFTDAFGSQFASGNFRFFYKARGDWALQIQKAAQSYSRVLSPNVGYAQFYTPVAGDAVYNASAANRTRMYFPLMDAGKSITIREMWYADAGGVDHKITNETFRINDDRTKFQNLAGQTLTFIDLKDKSQYSQGPRAAVAWDPAPSGTTAGGVQGTSFRARVIWNNGGTVVQTSNGNVLQTRWRRVDLDTFLTRSGGV